MTLELVKYTRLKKAVEDAQRESDRAAGALEQTMQRLKSEFGVDTLKAAEKLAAKLSQEAKAAEDEFNAALAKFEDEFKERLQ